MYAGFFFGVTIIDMKIYLLKIIKFFFLFFFTTLSFSETYELGGLYTYHYHDGRYADWGDYARTAAYMAIDDINNDNFLGDNDRLSMQPKCH